jgi:hypothetical protein
VLAGEVSEVCKIDAQSDQQSGPFMLLLGAALLLYVLVSTAVAFYYPNYVVRLTRVHPLAAAPKKDVDNSQADKLVYDQQQSRFYETARGDDTSEVQGDEFCLVDPDTGKYILLTKV